MPSKNGEELFRAYAAIELATIVHLSLASLDRYIAVFYSLRYPQLMTNRRVLKAMLASWAVVVGLSLSTELVGKVYIPPLFIVPSNMLFIGFVYFRISKEIRLEANPVVSANETEEQRKARERKSTRTIAIVVGLLCLCYVPMLLHMAIFLLQQFVLMRKNEPIPTIRASYVAVTFAALNLSLNVFVYYWRNSEIRSAILKVLEPIIQRFVHSVDPA